MTDPSPAGRTSSRSKKRAALIEAARQRRRELDPEAVARERRIDEAIVDLEEAWHTRLDALERVGQAEEAVSEALRRLAAENLTVPSIAQIIRVDAAELRSSRGPRQGKAARLD